MSREGSLLGSRPNFAAEVQQPQAPVAGLSMNEITTYRWTLPEELAAYRRAGIATVGLWRPKLSEFGEERGIELIRESGLNVSSLSWAGGFTGSNGDSYKEALHDALDAIRVAGELRAESVVIFSGGRGCHTHNHARRLVTDGLRACADLAGELGVALAVQPMDSMFAFEWTFLTCLDGTLALMDSCDHKAIKLAFDVYQLWRQPRLMERLPEITPRVAIVQLSDWRQPRSEADRYLPGDGEIPLKEIVSALTNSGYRGHFEIAVWSQELWNSHDERLLDDCRERYLELVNRR